MSGSNFSSANLITVAERIKTRSVLFDFLKFRVLAADQEFFAGTGFEHRRQWLALMHPQALVLSG
ncbi:MAG: hypothetical protein QNL17_02845 [Synechococcus sp. ChSW.bin.154]